MNQNKKVWEVIKEIKSGNLSLAEAKASMNETEWNILKDVFEITLTPFNNPNYNWSNAIILDTVNK